MELAEKLLKEGYPLYSVKKICEALDEKVNVLEYLDYSENDLFFIDEEVAEKIYDESLQSEIDDFTVKVLKHFKSFGVDEVGGVAVLQVKSADAGFVLAKDKLLEVEFVEGKPEIKEVEGAIKLHAGKEKIATQVVEEIVNAFMENDVETAKEKLKNLINIADLAEQLNINRIKILEAAFKKELLWKNYLKENALLVRKYLKGFGLTVLKEYKLDKRYKGLSDIDEEQLDEVLADLNSDFNFVKTALESAYKRVDKIKDVFKESSSEDLRTIYRYIDEYLDTLGRAIDVMNSISECDCMIERAEAFDLVAEHLEDIMTFALLLDTIIQKNNKKGN